MDDQKPTMTIKDASGYLIDVVTKYTLVGDIASTNQGFINDGWTPIDIGLKPDNIGHGELLVFWKVRLGQ